MIIKALIDIHYAVYGPKKKKIVKPKKEVFFFCQYRMMRIMIKRRGLFLASILIYLVTLIRILNRIFSTYTIEPSEEEKQQFMMGRTIVAMESISRNMYGK